MSEKPDEPYAQWAARHNARLGIPPAPHTAQEQREYVVEWTIDITAGSVREAAQKALEIQRNRNSIATVFNTIDKTTGVIAQVDLEDPDDQGDVT